VIRIIGEGVLIQIMPGGPADFKVQLHLPPFKYGISFHPNGARVTIAGKVAGPQDATSLPLV